MKSHKTADAAMLRANPFDTTNDFSDEPNMNVRFVVGSGLEHYSCHIELVKRDRGDAEARNWREKMFKLAKTAVLSALIGLGGLAAVPATAQADGIYLNFGRHADTGFGIHVRDRDNRRNLRRACSPRRALHKASRMGVRHARIVRANRRIVKVAGRKHHRRVAVVFANRRGCPVAYR